MRLETAATKCDQKVKQSLIGQARAYYAEAADMRDLLQEAARRIKELEHDVFLAENMRYAAGRR
jgi:hypothetical protein